LNYTTEFEVNPQGMALFFQNGLQEREEEVKVVAAKKTEEFVRHVEDKYDTALNRDEIEFIFVSFYGKYLELTFERDVHAPGEKRMKLIYAGWEKGLQDLGIEG
jgi:hypothetical protein